MARDKVQFQRGLSDVEFRWALRRGREMPRRAVPLALAGGLRVSGVWRRRALRTRATRVVAVQRLSSGSCDNACRPREREQAPLPRCGSARRVPVAAGLFEVRSLMRRGSDTGPCLRRLTPNLYATRPSFLTFRISTVWAITAVRANHISRRFRPRALGDRAGDGNARLPPQHRAAGSPWYYPPGTPTLGAEGHRRPRGCSQVKLERHGPTNYNRRAW